MLVSEILACQEKVATSERSLRRYVHVRKIVNNAGRIVRIVILVILWTLTLLLPVVVWVMSPGDPGVVK